jgi:hypothetical protein
VTDTRECVECGTVFELDPQGKKLSCSPACAHERKKRQSREHARRKFVASPRRSGDPIPCEECGGEFRQYTPQQRYCCRKCQETHRQRRRLAEQHTVGRTCQRCGADGVARRPGIPICDECKSQKRDRVEYERRRTCRGYGITLEEFNAMLKAQGNRCAICKGDDPGASHNWHIDHCHESGVVRGLLCSPCNLGLGFLKDDPEVMYRAVEYIKAHRQLRLVV